MATFDLPELPEPRAPRQLMLGAVSPLWAYFGAAAAGGVAYWWMTRWTRPVNLEALFGGVAKPTQAMTPVLEAVAEPVIEAVEAVADAAETVVETAAEAVIETSDAVTETAAEAFSVALSDPPIGGEAAPIAPLAKVLAAPEPEPVVEASPEPALEIAPEPVVEATPEPEPVVEAAPEPQVEAAPAPEPEAPTMVEAIADPLPPPVAKPRARKTPPTTDLEG